MLPHARIPTHQRRQANRKALKRARKSHLANSPGLGPDFGQLQASRRGETHKRQDTHSFFGP